MDDSTRIDQTVPGGWYFVNGRYVNSEGEPLDPPADTPVAPVDPPANPPPANPPPTNPKPAAATIKQSPAPTS